jgi:hypothetical protein
MYSPIRSAADLPEKEGAHNEGQHREFKSEPSTDRFELAKDVAAFANADGGTILIGAKGNGEYFGGYKPMTEKDASAAQRALDEAVRDRCSPYPFFVPVPIKKDGGIVLAVNVDPFPGQAVGVEVKPSEVTVGQSKKGLEILYWYPLRIGAHIKGIRPEQLPMFIDARIRRIVIALGDAIGQPVVLTDSGAGERPTGIGMWTQSGRLASVDVLGNAVTVNVEGFRRTRQRSVDAPVTLPFDAIETAYRQGAHWRIVIRGRLAQETSDGAGLQLVYDAY